MAKDTHSYTQSLTEAWGRHILTTIQTELESIKINQGRILSTLNQQKTSAKISDYEFKVFSQWGEDGIIQHLINSIEVENKTFVEFGVEDFSESNCRFLLMKDDWEGFAIDGSGANMHRLRSSQFYWKHNLQTKEAFVTRDNIEGILQESGFDEDLGLLSIDVDGVDYFILESIKTFKPRILILEFNPLFGGERKITVPYRPDFNRTKAHYSNLYYGASLAAMSYLAEKKGYSLAGTGTSGGNAFFVRSDLLNDRIRQETVAQAYRPSNLRESRDENGNLTHLAGNARNVAITGMPVVNVVTGQTETL